MSRRTKKVISYVAAVLLFFTALATVLTACAWRALDTLPDMAYRITDQSYTDYMTNAVMRRVRTTLALTVITPEDISDIVTERAVDKSSAAALKYTLSALLNKAEKNDMFTFESDELRVRVEELLTAYADEHEIELDADAVDETYGALCLAIGSELRVLPEAYVTKLAPYLEKAHRLLSFWYIPALVSLLLIGVISFLNKKKPFRSALFVLTPLYFSTYILAVTAWLFRSRDYLSNTVISSGTISMLVSRVYYIFFNNMRTVALMLTLALALLIIAAVVNMTLRPVSRSSSRKRSR